MTKPSDQTVLAWMRLLRAQTAALGSVQATLKAAGLPPLEWYDALLELERGGAMRPRALQARLLVAQYNLSRLLDRLAQAALIERLACEEDGRGHLVAITAQGQDMRRRMWPVYAAAIEQAVGAKLNAEEAGRLADLLGRIAG